MARKISIDEISQHDKPNGIWIVVNGKVYDMTAFASEHPGGAEIIHQYAGQDASAKYNSTHSPSLIKEYDGKLYLGELDTTTITEDWARKQKSQLAQPTTAAYQKPELEDIINLYDFEKVASKTFTRKGWAYANGAANDNITRDANISFLQRIWLRPAVMRNVTAARTHTNLFGCNLDAPVYISPVGAIKTFHHEGELPVARGAHATGIIQCISTVASYTLKEILDVTPEQAFLQLYINKDRPKTEAQVRYATASGKVKAFFVTADLPVMSKREDDERVNIEDSTRMASIAQTSSGKQKKSVGLGRINGAYIDPSLNWDDLKWLRSLTHLPILLKGVQRAEDAKMAMEVGFDGIVISNHGGRSADTAPPSILILLEIRRNCPEVFSKMKVLVDGGFRRGSDVVKAICLGASAVGLGRPLIYSLTYGQEGLEHAIEIVKDEIKTAMQLIGMTDLMRDASPRYLNTADIDSLVPSRDTLSLSPSELALLKAKL